MKIKKSTIRKIIREAKEEYQTFFKTACKKFGIDIENIENISDEKKKKLFSYIDKNWNSNSESGKDGKINEEVQFDFYKTMQVIRGDTFLDYIFGSSKGKNDKVKAEKIFNDHILGDAKLEKKYTKAK